MGSKPLEYVNTYQYRKNTWNFSIQVVRAADNTPVHLGSSVIHFGVKRDINDVAFIFRHDDIWASSTRYVLGNFVVPTVNNNRAYECTTAGTSGAVEPRWGTIVGGTTTDGTVVWTCRLIRVKIVKNDPLGIIDIEVPATLMDIAPETYYYDVKRLYPVDGIIIEETLVMGSLIISNVPTL